MGIMNVNMHQEEIPDMVYSSYQTDFFDAVKRNEDNLILEAVAGSGKTTTIVHACNLIDPMERSLFAAFNKSIADELASKVPGNVGARTLHSLGLEILRGNFKKVKVSTKLHSNRLYQYINAKNNKVAREWFYTYGRDALKVLSRLKALGCEVDEPNHRYVQELIYALDLDIPDTELNRSVILHIWDLNMQFDGEENHEIDFDDMIYFAVKLDVRCPEFDNVIVDEAQDLNKMQRQFLHKLLAPEGRLIAVGDTAQSIYGFRGADHSSMANIRHEFSCHELPLSITYRCSKAVTERAKEFVPHIECLPTAEEGMVTRIDHSDLRFMIKSGDFLLCRCWAPLMKEAMALSLQGNNVCILGNDIVPSLNKYAKDIGNMYDSINRSTIWDYFALQVAGLPEGQEWKEYSMREKCQVIAYIVGDGYLQPEEVRAVLKEIFTDKPPVTAHIMLSTIHRVKGLEADNVFILRPDLLPHPLSKSKNELIQEDNLHYVAVTRARENLYYVDEED